VVEEPPQPARPQVQALVVEEPPQPARPQVQALVLVLPLVGPQSAAEY
jgi:hypothetical protein